jgi:hypothetical protein
VFYTQLVPGDNSICFERGIRMKILGIIMLVISVILVIVAAYYWHKLNKE